MTQLINRHTQGVYIIVATPFDDAGAVDLNSLDRLVDFYVQSGVTGLTILGMMGEANKLTLEERHQIIDRVMARTTLPVVVGVSDAGIASLADLGTYAMDKGSAGLMIAPSSGPAREDRVEGYFHAVCKALGPDAPVVFQDFPQSTGIPVSPGLIRRLSEDLPQIVMLKHEDCPGLTKISTLRAEETTGQVKRLSILTGNGGLYLPQELARGADGAMTGFAYPEALVNTVNLFRSGDIEAAEDYFDRFLPILRHEQQLGWGLAVRKYLLMRRGAIACAATRAPGPRLTPTDIAEVDRLMARTDRKLKDA